jgi:molecular chaperone HscC
LFSPIIERNTPVPVSRVEQYHTISDGQAQVEIGVYQGEALRVRDSIKLGEMSIRVPRGPAGEQSIDVRFTYDINGLLEVEVEVKSTGRSERVLIQSEESPLSEKDVQKRPQELAHLKAHPRENMENVAVVARAERLYQERLGEERDYIRALLSQFEQVLQQQDPAAIDEARVQLSEALDELDSNLLF